VNVDRRHISESVHSRSLVAPDAQQLLRLVFAQSPLIGRQELGLIALSSRPSHARWRRECSTP
jgi:hypothetical protein